MVLNYIKIILIMSFIRKKTLQLYGIKDLITDITDGTQATTVIEEQMGLAQTVCRCHERLHIHRFMSASRTTSSSYGLEGTRRPL